jgi:hypothetical protein
MSTPPVAFDKSPVDLGGDLRLRRVRVLWKDGVLYIASSRTHVAAYAAAQPPAEWVRGQWRITLDDGRVLRLTKRGCSCSYALAKVAASELLAAAGVPA